MHQHQSLLLDTLSRRQHFKSSQISHFGLQSRGQSSLGSINFSVVHQQLLLDI